MKNIISVLWERGFLANSWTEDIEEFIKYFVDNIKKDQSVRQIEIYLILMKFIVEIDECVHDMFQVEAKTWCRDIDNGKLYFICYGSEGKYLIEQNNDETIKLLLACGTCFIKHFVKVKIKDLILKKETGNAYIFNYNKKPEKGLKPKFIDPQKTKITTAEKAQLLLNMIMCRGLLKEKE